MIQTLPGQTCLMFVSTSLYQMSSFSVACNGVFPCAFSESDTFLLLCCPGQASFSSLCLSFVNRSVSACTYLVSWFPSSFVLLSFSVHPGRLEARIPFFGCKGKPTRLCSDTPSVLDPMVGWSSIALDCLCTCLLLACIHVRAVLSLVMPDFSVSQHLCSMSWRCVHAHTDFLAFCLCAARCPYPDHIWQLQE